MSRVESFAWRSSYCRNSDASNSWDQFEVVQVDSTHEAGHAEGASALVKVEHAQVLVECQNKPLASATFVHLISLPAYSSNKFKMPLSVTSCMRSSAKL